MKRKGNPCIVLGLLLVVAALFLTVYNVAESVAAGNASSKVLEKMNASLCADGKLGTARKLPYSADTAMPTVEIDGYEYLGVLEIPSQALVLPVISEWSYDKLKIAPCRYAGSAYSRNLVIAAHDYTTHFGKLTNLQVGNEVTFTDVTGNVFSYKVTEIEVVPATAVEEMTAGEGDLTLFTCTFDGKSRVAVRCVSC